MDSTPSEMLDLAGFIGVTGIQPYGAHRDATIEAAIRAGLDVLLPIAVSDARLSLLDVADNISPGPYPVAAHPANMLMDAVITARRRIPTTRVFFMSLPVIVV